MKTIKVTIIALLAAVSLTVAAQPEDRHFLDVPLFFMNVLGPPVKNTKDYDEILGTPYLNSGFTNGILYYKDTTAVKVPLRYNIYTDQMECRLNDVIYEVGNIQTLNKISIGDAVFVYLPFIGDGGYFELLEGGECFLFLQRTVSFKPEEGPKPPEGITKPARFVAEPDVFYIVVGDSQPVEIRGMKSLVNALADQKGKVESYIKSKGLKASKKEDLVKIARYYNSLQNI